MVMNETPLQTKAREEAHKKAADQEAELKKAVADLRKQADGFNPGKVEVKLAQPPKKGECPVCHTPAPAIGILLGPPWRHQLATMRAELAAYQGKPDKADEIPIEEVHQALLRMHGGFIVDCQGEIREGEPCGNSYLCRVNEWPGVKLTPSE